MNSTMARLYKIRKTAYWFPFFVAITSIPLNAEFKQGYYNSEKVTEKSVYIGTMTKIYNKLLLSIEQEAGIKKYSINSIEEKLRKSSLLLPIDEKRNIELKLDKLKTEYQKFITDAYGVEGYVKKGNLIIIQPVIDSAQIILKTIARERKFDAILDLNSGIVAYYNKEYDITNEVIAAINNMKFTFYNEEELKALAKSLATVVKDEECSITMSGIFNDDIAGVKKDMNINCYKIFIEKYRKTFTRNEFESMVALHREFYGIYVNWMTYGSDNFFDPEKGDKLKIPTSLTGIMGYSIYAADPSDPIICRLMPDMFIYFSGKGIVDKNGEKIQVPTKAMENLIHK